ncbi:MAG: hypothetical protein AAFY76_01885 [Cyanobacteria bacterium J06649_11]
MTNAAPGRRKRHFNQIFYDNYSRIYQNNQYPEKSKKRYPYSAYSVKLLKHCPYCEYQHGLIIIRFKEDKGYCRCGRCDAALFSLNESKPEKGLTHIGGILDSYLPYGEAAQ